jgi:hypothetical protein
VARANARHRRLLGGEHASYRSRKRLLRSRRRAGHAPGLAPRVDSRRRPAGEDAAQFDGWLLEGYSVIVAPTGEPLAGPLVRERGILIADLDLGSLPARKRLFDPTGHYNRPDVFRLMVDDSPKPSVVVKPFPVDH